MINCTITSPEKTIVYRNVQSIMLPAFFGQMQILHGHAESFVVLQKGNIYLRQLNSQDTTIPIMDGECYVKNDEVTVIL